MLDLTLPPSWQTVLQDQIDAPYFQKLQTFLTQQYQDHTVYPPAHLIFNALQQCAFENVKVVIVGQDPYHGEGQAQGLSFAVNDGVALPPSLRNIFKELHSDMGIPISKTGNLLPWAQQGVLLLNAILTVRANTASSHKKQGWETFTDALLATLIEQREHLIFLLWGKFAQEKLPRHAANHLFLTAAHPSPLSAKNGFFGCRHFSQTNNYLEQHGQTPIDWAL